MIRSMTGFGAAEMTTEERRISIEMRAVNNRYLDFNIRMPKRYIPLEGKIRELLKKTIHRGKVDVYISEERCGAGKGALMLDRELAAQYIEKIAELSRLVREAYPYAEELQNPAVTRLSGLDIARFPEVLTLVEGETNEDELWDSLSACLSEAVKKFDESRLAEGERLREDLLGKLDLLAADVETVIAEEPRILADYQARLLEKAKEVLGDRPLDDGQLASAVVMYADKISTDEETVRLRSHIVQMREIFEKGESGEGVGRKLDFLTQEMNREANTTLSKAGNLLTANVGIEMKTTIEKIREQIQNIE